MEANLKGTVGVVILVGLVFLCLATLAFVNYNFKEAIPITTNTTTLNYVIDVNTPQTLVEEPVSSATLTTPNQTWLNFDGQNDWIDFGDINDIGNDNITMSIWFNASKISGTTNKELIAKRNTSASANIGYVLELSSTGTLKFFLSNGTLPRSLMESIRVYNDSSWHNVIVSLDRNSGSNMYVDGYWIQSTNMSNVTGNIDSDLSFNIGRNNVTGGGGNFFNGSLDQVYISKTYYNPSQALSIFKNGVYGNNISTIPILMYHYICDYANTTTCVNTTEFTNQMKTLNYLGYNTITDREYYNWTQNQGFTIPNKPIMLVFDDAEITALTKAAPIMSNYSYKATLGVIANNTYASNKLTTTNLTYLVNVYNWSLASHSVSHCDLIKECNQSANMLYEMNVSKNIIVQNTSFIPISFIYPQNSYNVTSNNICDDYYSICFGGSFSIITNKTHYVANKTSNLTNGALTRSSIINETSISDYLFLVNNTIGDFTFKLNLNENNGTTAYDTSGNNNNGVISGASWQTDGQTRTITSGYLITGTNFTLTDSSLAYSFLNLSYVYESEDVVARDVLDAANLEIVNNTSLAGLILTVSLIAVVISIIIGVFLIQRRGL